MAKVISLINLKGTVGDYTFVKSARYGDHIRAKRGTHKKAELNDAFKEQTKKIPGANLHAKIFKDAINPHRKELIERKDSTAQRKTTYSAGRKEFSCLRQDRRVQKRKDRGSHTHSSAQYLKDKSRLRIAIQLFAVAVISTLVSHRLCPWIFLGP